MKNLTKQLGIIIFSLIILFVMAACIEDDGKDESSDGALGDTLNLSGKVYIENANPFVVTYEPYVGSDPLEVTEYDSGKKGYIGGKGNFEFSMEIPNNSLLDDFIGMGTEMDDMYLDIDITADTGTKTFTIASFKVSGGYTELSRVYNSRKVDLATAKMTVNSISAIYIYTTNDITVKAKGKTIEVEDMLDLPVDIISNNIDFTLKKGWNILKTSISGTITLADISDPSSASGSLTMSMTTADSSNLRWVLK